MIVTSEPHDQRTPFTVTRSESVEEPSEFAYILVAYLIFSQVLQLVNELKGVRWSCGSVFTIMKFSTHVF